MSWKSQDLTPLHEQCLQEMLEIIDTSFRLVEILDLDLVVSINTGCIYGAENL